MRISISAFIIWAVLFGAIGDSPAFAEEQNHIRLGADVGYRSDSLDWNIGGFLTNFGFVDVLSELTWEDLDIYQVKVRGEVELGKIKTTWLPNYFRGYADYGWILGGENQDSDWAGDNRTLEFSRSNNGADDGDVYDLSIAAGRNFVIGDSDFRWAPLIGYSYHEQNLKIVDGKQTLFDKSIVAAINNIPVSEVVDPDLTGLNSTYDTEWWGVWYGIDLEYQPNPEFRVLGSFEYHFAEFYAVANWNLRDDFAHPRSFEHEGDGQGILLALSGEYMFSESWSATLGFDYADWKVDDGVDRVFLASGPIAQARLNEVNWESFSVTTGMTLRF